jgi:hypothetical protein
MRNKALMCGVSMKGLLNFEDVLHPTMVRLHVGNIPENAIFLYLDLAPKKAINGIEIYRKIG